MTIDIPSIIRSETAKILQASRSIGVFSAWHVNNGSCYELAKNVSEILRTANVDHEILDNIWLIRRGPMEGRRSGIGRMGQHYFVFANGKYFDSECPDGVASPYEMPLAIAAVESKEAGVRIAEFLANDDDKGEFPCPEPVKGALRDTWKGYVNAEPSGRLQEARLLSIALRDVCGPIEMNIGVEDLDRFGRTVARVLCSIGIDAMHEHGTDPKTTEPTTWLRFEDGSIGYLDLAPLDRQHGRYLRDGTAIVHPSDNAHNSFIPVSGNSFGM